ncbi:hypothetical protein [Amycolatopsis sp. Hca4]|uniref:hypothetical protein n=1 Tax=Amycolatopsis sp. Hca4 TaxID=2742131 RepID=UPI00159005C0|nr:hypothetical protein [Amycolatopsis sp. Hca4]QKV79938.1 hypothetical protein HUT10_43660 [Amycolatopsis sp. Hca4]
MISEEMDRAVDDALGKVREHLASVHTEKPGELGMLRRLAELFGLTDEQADSLANTFFDELMTVPRGRFGAPVLLAKCVIDARLQECVSELMGKLTVSRSRHDQITSLIAPSWLTVDEAKVVECEPARVPVIKNIEYGFERCEVARHQVRRAYYSDETRYHLTEFVPLSQGEPIDFEVERFFAARDKTAPGCRHARGRDCTFQRPQFVAVIVRSVNGALETVEAVQAYCAKVRVILVIEHEESPESQPSEEYLKERLGPRFLAATPQDEACQRQAEVTLTMIEADRDKKWGRR